MAATSGSAGWDRGCWSRRSSFAGSRDTNRFRRSSENWKLWHRLSWGLSNGERRRRVDYAGVATFNGVPGILPKHPLMHSGNGNVTIREVSESRSGRMTLGERGAVVFMQASWLQDPPMTPFKLTGCRSDSSKCLYPHVVAVCLPDQSESQVSPLAHFPQTDVVV